ncbi:hypothetical protein D3C72_1663860 [compost metagenome]
MARQRQGYLLVEQAQQVLVLLRQGVARGEILALVLQCQLLGKFIGVETVRHTLDHIVQPGQQAVQFPGHVQHSI